MKPSLTIVADAHIWGAESAFAELPGFDVDLRIVENSDITPEVVEDADILMTRSSTKVDAGLLEGSGVRFVATATIGDDHFDKAYLKSRGIAFANAAGSSTGSVIEYMATVLLELHVRSLINIPATSIGIIGAGRIGGRFESICRGLGMHVLVNDPPRARTEGGAGFSSLEQVLDSADVISLHTPLTHEGGDATWHLLDQDKLQRFQGRGIINAGRGACLDDDALSAWLDADGNHFAVLDCWEHEPDISRSLLAHRQLAIATPHIAGHSLDGKAANTQFAYNALCRFLGVAPAWDMHAHLPQADKTLKIDSSGDIWRGMHEAATTLYPLMRDDHQMRTWLTLPADELPAAFTGYRRHYPVRRAWEYVSVQFTDATDKDRRLMRALGLKLG